MSMLVTFLGGKWSIKLWASLTLTVPVTSRNHCKWMRVTETAENGERGTGNGERGTGNGERTRGKGK